MPFFFKLNLILIGESLVGRTVERPGGKNFCGVEGSTRCGFRGGGLWFSGREEMLVKVGEAAKSRMAVKPEISERGGDG